VPETIRRATLLRLARLPASTAAIARAVAVLGAGAEVRRVAALANVDPDEALAAVDALVEMGLLAPGRPVSFAHPILRAAVYDELAIPARASAHRRAAGILAAEGASPEQVAAQLLHTEPEGAPEAVATLRAAATEALARGAPDGAVAYLRRALEEPIPAERGALLHELGRVELLATDHAAIDDFEEAIALAPGPVDRARVICDAFPVYLLAASFDHLRATISALEQIDDVDRELVAELSGYLATVEAYDPRLVAEYDRKLPSRRQLADTGGPSSRLLNGLLAAIDALRGARAGEVLQRVERALDGGRLLSAEGAASTAVIQTACALIIVDELERADALTAEMVADGRRRGSALGFASGLAHKALVDARLGRLAIAEADFMLAASLAREHELPYANALTLVYAADVLLERPAARGLADAALAIELPPALAGTATGGWLRDVRGRLLRARGEAEAAVAELELASEVYGLLGFDGLLGIGWRDELALALPPERREEALRLAEESVEQAAARGSARAQGIALRALGLLQGGETGLDSLRVSLSVLDRAPAPLERARTLVELGAALRRSGERASAREPLRAGLDLAERCGAQRLSERSLTELRATGAKPRRRTIEGRDALTPSETRVAEMAAGGMSNRAIAQALFVTAKTVENQLGAVYLKLGIHRRDQLADALAAGAPEEPSKT
jgi:DNA-binding CsgD family transcriptional regulator